MAGYRDTSSFDPNAGAEYGPPLRPFNWMQWTGVAFVVLGVAIDLAYLAGRAGITAKYLDSPSIGISLPLLGAVLVNSRRQPGGLSPAVKRQRLVIIAIAGAVMVLAAIVAILLSKGA